MRNTYLLKLRAISERSTVGKLPKLSKEVVDRFGMALSSVSEASDPIETAIEVLSWLNVQGAILTLKDEDVELHYMDQACPTLAEELAVLVDVHRVALTLAVNAQKQAHAFISRL